VGSTDGGNGEESRLVDAEEGKGELKGVLEREFNGLDVGESAC
jgi:hypothetical protein